MVNVLYCAGASYRGRLSVHPSNMKDIGITINSGWNEHSQKRAIWQATCQISSFTSSNEPLSQYVWRERLRCRARAMDLGIGKMGWQIEVAKSFASKTRMIIILLAKDSSTMPSCSCTVKSIRPICQASWRRVIGTRKITKVYKPRSCGKQ